MTTVNGFYVSADAAQSVLRDGVGKLDPGLLRKGQMRSLQLFDTFDAEIASLGRLLVQSDEYWALFVPGQGSLTQACAGPERSASDFAEGPVKAALQDMSRLRALVSFGCGEVQNSNIALLDRVQKTRMRRRLTCFNSHEGGALFLADMRGLSGYDQALKHARKRLRAQDEKKKEGVQLLAALFPDRAAEVAKPPINVGRKDAAIDAANDIIRTNLPIARINEAGIIDDVDIEFLHDYRIALRKIRSVLTLFSGVYAEMTTFQLKARFSALMAPTGPLRDLDVFLLEKDDLYDLLPESMHVGLEKLADLLSDQRIEVQADVGKRFRSEAYGKEIDALADLFCGSKRLKPGANAQLCSLDYSRALIWKRYRKVCKTAAAIDDTTKDEEVHRLRIHGKKLRYLIEFLARVCPRSEIRRILQPLKKLQDTLGLSNDYSVQRDNLRATLTDLEDANDDRSIAIAQSIDALIVVLHRKQLKERAKVVDSFATLNGTETLDRFRALFKAKRAVA